MVGFLMRRERHTKASKFVAYRPELDPDPVGTVRRAHLPGQVQVDDVEARLFEPTVP